MTEPKSPLVAGLVERLTSLKYPQAVMDAADALTRMVAELAAEKAAREKAEARIALLEKLIGMN